MRLFEPILAGAHGFERSLACLGAAAGIGITAAICSRWPHDPASLPMIVAPLGASAVLAFAVPASPLAQPWSVVGGNIVSALVGVATYRLVRDPVVAAGLAVGLAILAMSLLRCLHPPGGAVALTAVVGSVGVHAAGFGFALAPVGINSVALAASAMMFHRLAGRSYPHRAAAAPGAPALHLADIDAALDELRDSFDIAREDLEVLFAKAQDHANRRTTPTGRR